MKKKLRRTKVDQMVKAVVALAPDLTDWQKEVLAMSLQGVDGRNTLPSGTFRYAGSTGSTNVPR
jgi:hypothetical protein